MNGIHHVTAIAGDARRSLEFYADTLGLRLVKRTVNFDDPGTHHLYFGDEAGTPGSILTFFPWAHAAARQGGTGELDETGLRVPAASLDWWAERLRPFGAERTTRFGDSALALRDPDGLGLLLVGVADPDEPGWTGGDVPPENAIRGVGGVRLHLDGTAATAAVLTEVFGFRPDGTDGEVARFRLPGLAVGGTVDLRDATGAPARLGRGAVHHLAFRARDDAEQAEMAARLARDHGLHPTAQKDRDYFRSIYFRSPGGVLFEIATDGPGFAVDEPADALGGALKLPPFLRDRRAAIEAALPPLA